MKILLITYDLNSPGKNYTGLYDTIKTATKWWHYLDSCWLIQTNLNPTQWINKLKNNLDDNDNLFVVELNNRYDGWLPKKAWEWIKTYLPEN